MVAEEARDVTSLTEKSVSSKDGAYSIRVLRGALDFGRTKIREGEFDGVVA